MEVHDFEIRETGEWEEVREFCAALSRALEAAVPEEKFAAFEAWRPKSGEDKDEIRERTVEESVIRETQVERDSDGAVSEFEHAGHKVKESGQDMLKGDARGSLEDAEEAGSSTVRGLLPSIVRLFRGVERRVYRYVVGRTNPDYFENDLFSVEIGKGTLARDRYTVTASFRDRDLLEQVERQLRGE